MIDHTSFSVKNFAESLKFYDETLGILGYQRIVDVPDMEVAGYGDAAARRPYFWISSGGKAEEAIGSARGVHIAFVAASVREVNDWYDKCIELNATDNGTPGPRAEYHPGYYGAFVIDPNGWRIEACIHNYEA